MSNKTKKESDDEVSGQLCACGCGEYTLIAKRTRPDRGIVKGQPNQYLLHHAHLEAKPKQPREVSNQLCACGCGNFTLLAKHNDFAKKVIKGEPNKFIAHHSIKKPITDAKKPREVSDYLCECGCGEYTLFADRNRRGRSAKGKPNRFINGHRLKRNQGVCSVDSCDRAADTSELCTAHYTRLRARGDVRPDVPIGEGNKGLRKKENIKGYRNVKYKGRSIGEHRAVWMAEHGEIPSWVHIHHRNGIKSDNRLQNLEAFICRHPYGQRVEDQIKFAEEIIKRYGS